MDQMQAEEEEVPRDEGAQAVSMLDAILAEDERFASFGLQSLFEIAGETPLVQDRGELGTERLLMAIVNLDTAASNPASAQEKAALKYAADLMFRHSDQFATLLGNRQTTPDSPDRGAAMLEARLSPNVARAVREAAAHVSLNAAEPTREVTIMHFLAVFPPAGSAGADLLGQLGVDLEEFQRSGTELVVHGFQLPRGTADEGHWPTNEGLGRIARELGAAITIDEKGFLEIIAPDQGRVDAVRSAIDDAVRELRDKLASGRTGAAKKAATRKPRAQAPRYEERVFTHADEPAEIDELGRDPFAEVLARRIREARTHGAPDGPSAFIVHLHGPWGSGKSSVLNFLEAKLAPDPWLVVRFNAWRNQRLQPPWWALITRIYDTARKELDWRRALRLRLRWLFWRIRADYVPVIAVAACAVVLVLLVLWVGAPRAAVEAVTGAEAATPAEEQLADWFDRLLKLVAAAITIATAVVLWSRSLAMGSQKAAQAYADIKSDPYRPIARLFDRLVAAIDRPVVVFVDDLDRCDSKYVVDLLEGIQTLMRGAPVTYVVAGDRKWICSSFQQRYAGFAPPIGEPGRPLGYLFLDKIFQMSAAIPQPGAETGTAYWKALLAASPGDRAAERARQQAAEDRADVAAAGLNRQEDLQKFVARAEQAGDEVEIRARRAAAAKRIASKEIEADIVHRLERFRVLLEPNPRAMKRLVNAYGMHQSTLLLAGRAASPDALARWTMLELRWPLLADWLAGRPAHVDWLRAPLPARLAARVPDELHDLFGDETVAAVVGPRRGRDRLTPAAIHAILGAAQGER